MSGARTRITAGCAVLLLLALASVLPEGAAAEQASEPTSLAAGQLDAGASYTCALATDQVRCWGFGREGELGYPGITTVGATDTPGSVGPVNFGPGRTAVAISAGDYHTCAILDDGNMECWGFGGDGRLGYGNTNNLGDRQTPGAVGPVDLGLGPTGLRHTAQAISAGGAHTCAILDDGSVRCWGFGFSGQLGYGNKYRVGDGATNVDGGPDQSVASVGPVNLGPGHTATAISAGSYHTCAILDDGSVRCWGYGANGQLGYGNTNNVGDGIPTKGAPADQTVASAGPVDLGGHTAQAISAGGAHTCAILDDGSVRCWGYNADGQLGYGNTGNVGDQQTPGSAGPVYLGPERTARAISAGKTHTCAVLDDGSVRCWGYGGNGRLGYGNTSNVGDAPTATPGTVGPVDLGAGRTATAISAGEDHTCARLDDGHVRCWGFGGNGRLGYCNESNVGDMQPAGSAGPVNLLPGDGGVPCVPVNVSVPSVSGQAVQGQTLTESHGSWSGSPTAYGYQWQRCDGAGADCVAIAGASAQSYTLTNADVADTIRVQETASNAGGAGVPASSAQTALVTGVPVDLSPPSLSGEAVQGQTLTEAHGSWSGSPIGYGYRWQRCDRSGRRCVAISGASGQRYTLTGADVAHRLRVRETARNLTGDSAPVSSAPSGLVAVADALRARGLRSCLAAVSRHLRRDQILAGHGSARQRAQAKLKAKRDSSDGRRGCLRRYARTPGRVGALRARARGSTRIELDFTAPGTDGTHPPPAHSYLVKQSLHPIRNQRDFAHGQALCHSACRFTVTQIGAKITLTITGLKPHTTYYYTIAALDNASPLLGPRSPTVRARTL